MVRDLDELLAVAAPPVAPRTPELRRSLDELVAITEAEASPRRPRRRRNIGIATAAAAVVLGAGVTAQATGNLLPNPEGGWENPPVWSISLDAALPSGEQCQVVYMISPVQTEKYRHSKHQWDTVWAAATEYLASVKAESLVSQEIQDRYRRSVLRAEARLRRTLPPEEVGPGATSEVDVILGAPGAELMARLNAELRRHGLPTDMVLMVSSNNCDPAALQ